MKKPSPLKGRPSPLRGRPSPHRGKGGHYQWLKDRVDLEDGECLIWPGTRNWNGYGMLGVDGKVTYAHRVMCRLVHGDPPTPKHVAAHTCHNGSGGCCHPKHVVWKTPRENLLDRRAAGTLTNKRWDKFGVVPDADIIRIQKLKGKLNQREIADLFGISYQHVSVIQNRKLIRQNT